MIIIRTASMVMKNPSKMFHKKETTCQDEYLRNTPNNNLLVVIIACQVG